MRGPIAIAVLVVLIFLGLNSVFVVDEREKALVLRFGEVQQVKTEPGLGFKIPVVDTIVKYDDRILSLTTQPLEVTPEDDRRLVVDAFARWRIVDAVKFREAVGAGGETTAKSRIDGILNNAIREVLGSVPSTAVLSDDRTPLMNRIRDLARREALSLGVDVIDVRLTRTDLPEQNLASTYGRMRAEREREAADERARGAEAAQRIRATADRTAVEVTSEAKKQAEIVRGEADAQANKVYADAYGKDRQFFAFVRALQFYAQSMKTQTSSLVTQPDSLYFDYGRFLRSIGENPGPETGAGRGSASASQVGQ
ncbi:membrane protease subunit HflC [Thioclava sp. ES.031]|jgi:membrane protease subunit HflC|uniref:Protein HflC n=3 Tax=Paracoccaceae TaxID=31989 RepID=A0ABX6YTC0_9RHOB|nr:MULTISPECIES: protease modulator HflC [Thioclava]MAQ37622.1 protease modulator HflC [Thioclava sp.]MPQ92326.1 protease modulator HflC [Thioclava sp. JE_KL1]PFG62548.1 membrane protease subunit HflC [Thioclava sp. ES.031]QPZ90493.1 protease modulator HflC [Thioclava electrotropha]